MPRLSSLDSPRLTRRRAIALASGAVAVAALGRTTGQELLPAGRIAFIRKGDIWVWQNGEASRIVQDGAASDPRWAPTGQFILFVRSGDSFSDLILRDVNLGSESQLTFNQSQFQIGSPDYVLTSSWVLDPDWSPSGLIAFASDNTADDSMILWLLADPELTPEPAPSAAIEDDVEGVSLSSDGTIAAYTVRSRGDDGTNHTYVALRDLSDGTPYDLADDPSGVFDPAIAPDNQRIAVAIRGGDGITDIWLVDRESGDLSRVTTGAQATKPAWSPDGSWLAFMRMIDYRFEVWAAPVQGVSFGEPQRLFRFQNLDGSSKISWTAT